MGRKTIRAAKRHYRIGIERILSQYPQYLFLRNKKGQVTHLDLVFRDELYVPPAVRGEMIGYVGNLILLGESIKLGHDLADHVMDSLLAWKIRYKHNRELVQACEEAYLAVRNDISKHKQRRRKLA